MDEGNEWLEPLFRCQSSWAPQETAFTIILSFTAYGGQGAGGSSSQHMMESFPLPGNLILLSPNFVDEVTVAQKS